MMKNKGFTLIETIVVLGILATIALFGVENIVEFQKNALLSSTAQEFASALRRAQSMSIAGQLPENLKNKVATDFDIDAHGLLLLPQYGVELSVPNYSIFTDYKLIGQPASHDSLETLPIDPRLSITPLGNLTFTRLTGLTTPTTFDVKRLDNNRTIQVAVNDKGAITINPL